MKTVNREKKRYVILPYPIFMFSVVGFYLYTSNSYFYEWLILFDSRISRVKPNKNGKSPIIPGNLRPIRYSLYPVTNTFRLARNNNKNEDVRTKPNRTLLFCPPERFIRLDFPGNSQKTLWPMRKIRNRERFPRAFVPKCGFQNRLRKSFRFHHATCCARRIIRTDRIGFAIGTHVQGTRNAGYFYVLCATYTGHSGGTRISNSLGKCLRSI